MDKTVYFAINGNMITEMTYQGWIDIMANIQKAIDESQNKVIYVIVDNKGWNVIGYDTPLDCVKW